MNIFSIKTILLFSVCIFAFSTQDLMAYQAKLVKVHDGDTITVQKIEDSKKVRIKLYGIEAPERMQKHGRIARSYLKDFIDKGILEIEEMGKDHYRRKLAIVKSQGLNVNEQMISSGYAWVRKKHCKAAFCKQWKKTQEIVRKEKRGLWQCKRPVPPWEWREERRFRK